MFTLTKARQNSGLIQAIEVTHSLKIAMDHPIAMEIYQPLSGICQLEDFQLSPSRERQSRKPGDLQARACLHSGVPR